MSDLVSLSFNNVKLINLRKLKLIWDFRGPDAHKIAEHHEIHLKQFIQQEAYKVTLTGVESLNSNHAIAFMVVDERDMIPVRDALRPHRGEHY